MLPFYLADGKIALTTIGEEEEHNVVDAQLLGAAGVEVAVGEEAEVWQEQQHLLLPQGSQFH